MTILSPIDITLLTTNVAETDYPTWVAGTTYAIEEKVVYSHKVYESLIASNVGNQPDTNDEKWMLIGATNAYKCIDNKVSTYTQNSASIVMTFAVEKSISIAFMGVECSTLKVELLEGESVVWQQEQKGITKDITGWFSYFFGEFEFKNFFMFSHIYNPNATYRVTLTGDVCKLGVMLKGTLIDIGCTLWEASVGFVDYSKKDFDDFGEVYLKEGVYRDYFRGNISIPTGKLSLVMKLLRERRGKLSLYIPTETYDMPIYGWATEPELIWQNPVVSECVFDINGIT